MAQLNQADAPSQQPPAGRGAGAPRGRGMPPGMMGRGGMQGMGRGQPTPEQMAQMQAMMAQRKKMEEEMKKKIDARDLDP